MPEEEVMVVVRMPLRKLADEIRSRNKLTEELFDAKLEGDNLVLTFKRAEKVATFTAPDQRAHSVPLPTILAGTLVKRISIARSSRKARKRRKSRRNRMKTRGWPVVGKIVNSKGQTALIYKPFVDALFRDQLTPAQKRQVVVDILRANGNDPTESSVEYFLMNTLEYLAHVNKAVEVTA